MRNVYRDVVEMSKRKIPLGILNLDGKIILTPFLTK